VWKDGSFWCTVIIQSLVKDSGGSQNTHPAPIPCPHHAWMTQGFEIGWFVWLRSSKWSNKVGNEIIALLATGSLLCNYRAISQGCPVGFDGKKAWARVGLKMLTRCDDITPLPSVNKDWNFNRAEFVLNY
jgi:hypothetical protein